MFSNIDQEIKLFVLYFIKGKNCLTSDYYLTIFIKIR